MALRRHFREWIEMKRERMARRQPGRDNTRMGSMGFGICQPSQPVAIGRGTNARLGRAPTMAHVVSTGNSSSRIHCSTLLPLPARRQTNKLRQQARKTNKAVRIFYSHQVALGRTQRQYIKSVDVFSCNRNRR